jgi:sulfatase modifying factor 1
MKTIKLIFIIFILVIPFSLFSIERGLEISAKHLGPGCFVGKQWLVIIAINRYRQWPGLQYPVDDAKEIRDVLLHRYYIDECIELYDEESTKEHIAQLFIRLQTKCDVHDSLLIYYAGHGHLDKKSNSGFWIPYDAGENELEQKNWLPNTQIRGYISQMKVMHICLIIDSCFSGDILETHRGKPQKINNNYFQKAYLRTSRQVLTSCASEYVPDRSEFAILLHQTLQKNTSPYLDPLMLFEGVRLGMKKTTPLLGCLTYTGHQEGGTYLLFLRNHEEPGSDEDEQGKNIVITYIREKAYGNIEITARTDGILFIDDTYTGYIPENHKTFIEHIRIGNHTCQMDYGGNKEKKEIVVKKNMTASLDFTWEEKKGNNRFVLVRAGKFRMGNNDNAGNEWPVHDVTLGDFYIKTNEVTFKEYEVFCKAQGKEIPHDNGWGRDSRPVIHVSWYDAINYCNWLSKKEGFNPCYTITGKTVTCNFKANGYRLPTEAEWEYAARGGHASREYTFCGSHDAGEAGWYSKNSGRATHPVCRCKSNELGLYDMSGNVWEWCWDYYSSTYYNHSPEIDPRGPENGNHRVLRGGSWYNGNRYIRVTARGYSSPHETTDYFGFRLARTAD